LLITDSSGEADQGRCVEDNVTSFRGATERSIIADITDEFLLRDAAKDAGIGCRAPQDPHMESVAGQSEDKSGSHAARGTGNK
jgi:hypothetical protein